MTTQPRHISYSALVKCPVQISDRRPAILSEGFRHLPHCLQAQAAIFPQIRPRPLHTHVTVHRNKFHFNNQPDASIIQIYSVIKLYIFRASSLPIIRSFLLYIRHCKFHAGLMSVPKQSQDGTAIPS